MPEQPVEAPRRGDVFWVTFEPARGSEQRGTRPGLVIQNDRGNRSGRYTVVAAISSAPLPQVYPFTVPLPEGLNVSGHVNCAQLLTIDKARLGARLGTLPEPTMRQVDAALRYELAL